MRSKNKLITIILGLFFICVLFISLLKPDEEYSIAERRPLKEFPSITLSQIKSGRFMTGFEDYVLDQFPLREEFRKIKAFVEHYILQKKNNNDIYVEDGYAVEMVYPMNETSIKNAAKTFKSIYDAYLKDRASNVYFSMIPDKNYFAAETSGQLSMDYSLFLQQMKEEMSYMTYIDIIGSLTIDDYYRTDSHWRQEAIVDTAQILNEAMSSSLSGHYEKISLDRPFQGVYSGQWTLPLESDQIVCLTNDIIESYEVYDFENDRSIPVYNMEKAAGNDMYETYLSGSLSLITITNPSAENEKELLLFRDSFGSSIAPILAEGYSKVTMIDIRYLPWQRLESFVEFEDKDVLFLYSTALLNHNEIK